MLKHCRLQQTALVRYPRTHLYEIRQDDDNEDDTADKYDPIPPIIQLREDLAKEITSPQGNITYPSKPNPLQLLRLPAMPHALLRARVPPPPNPQLPRTLLQNPRSLRLHFPHDGHQRGIHHPRPRRVASETLQDEQTGIDQSLIFAEDGVAPAVSVHGHLPARLFGHFRVRPRRFCGNNPFRGSAVLLGLVE